MFERIHPGCFISRKFLLFLLPVMAAGCNNALSSSLPPMINYSVTEQYPHSITHFTEGLFFKDGRLYESTGSPDNLPRSRSLMGYTDLLDGVFVEKVELDRKKHFGEGLALLKNRIYQLTYGNMLGFIYDASSCEKIDSFHYPGKEGWGLTTDGELLIMSDGTDKLIYFDPGDMKVKKTLAITEGSLPRDSINELEYINGSIYANIWLRNIIVKIDPLTGSVIGKIDLSTLAEEVKMKNGDADVLNGIAYDALTGRVFVTGKLWPVIYVIKIPL